MDRTLPGLDATQVDDAGADSPDEQTRGAGIGRYLVLDRLGAGAMGVVYAAYDPELDRKVAVKLVRAASHDPAAGHGRLLREAQALARVAHPNVVTVHDVGSHAGQVFVAMEFVQGVTLTRWLQTPRPWREVLAALLRAGRGLAAVHAAGLVHRDFKPDNVMVGDDGRVRVMDFGLARVGGEAEAVPAPLEPDALALTGLADTQVSNEGTPPLSASSHALGLRLTRTGALLGTPAYMAPELYSGRAADARADQYALCVALYEALYRQHPFAATSVLGLAAAASAGQVRPAPAGTRVPAAVHRAVLRGLSPRPEDRWPDVPALLAALDLDPARHRGRWLAAGGLVLGLAAATYASTRTDSDTCSGGERQIAATWNDARRQAAAEAFAATGLSYAPAAWARVEHDLDEYSRAWAAMHRGACESHQRGEQSDDLLDLRMTCLEGQVQDLAALVEVLVAADATTVEHAAQAGEGLDGLQRCADLAALRARVAPPTDPAAVAAVEGLRARLARARAEQLTGRYAVGRELARAARLDADRIGYRPLIAEASLLAGDLAHDLGDLAEARAQLLTAHFEALATRHEPVAIAAAIALVHAVGDREHRIDEGETWARSAAALLEHLAASDPAWLALINARGVLYHDAGRLDDAEREYRDALARAARDHADQPIREAATHNNLALVLSARGDLAGARAELAAALAIYEQRLGPTHPKLIECLANLAGLAITEGKLDEAQAITAKVQEVARQAFPPDSPRLVMPLTVAAHLESSRGRVDLALPLYERALALLQIDEDHPDRATLHNNIGAALQQLHRHPEAATHFDHALQIRLRAFGPEHADVASVLGNIGSLQEEMGQRDLAITTLRRALEIQERLLGADHPDLGYTLTNLGDIERAEGRTADAERDLRRAIDIWTRGLGPEVSLLAYPQSSLGQLLLDRKQPALALPLLEAALARTTTTDPAELAELRFLLARALWDSGNDRSRARELARSAEPALRGHDDELAAKVKAWLAAHDR